MGIVLVDKDGLESNEERIASFDVIFKQNPQAGVPGELLLTRKSIVFLEARGVFGSSLQRAHEYEYCHITNVSIESQGLKGSISSQVFLSISLTTTKGPAILKYDIYKQHAERALGIINEQREKSRAPEKLRNLVLRLTKPKGRVKIRDIAKDSSVKSLAATALYTDEATIQEKPLFEYVRDVLTTLISEDQLDGIITDEGEYVSKVMLARETIQYHVVVDFASLSSQLQNKGVILQKIECPSCKGTLQYPETGNTIECKYCGAIVRAVDVFEKFKSLLT